MTFDGASAAAPVDAIVVGAGVAGLYSIYLLRERGLTVQGFETGEDVGGCWYWNRYPGARCDVASMQYSYGFSDDLQQEWKWSERYASQPEILEYLRHVADRFDLRRHYSFSTHVAAATYDEETALWTVRTKDGSETRARWLVMASGPLSVPRTPAIPGIDNYQGETLHTGAWPDEEPVFKGKRVGVIGTGSSGVQAIPVIATEAEHVTVFQRTANFVIPAGSMALGDKEQEDWKARYTEHREQAKQIGQIRDYSQPPAMTVSAEERHAEFDRRWTRGGTDFAFSFSDIMVNEEANTTAAEFVRGRIREIVKDPATAEKLVPSGFPLGSKRLCIGNNYYETFNRDNVTLVDLQSDPIEEVKADGIATQSGFHQFDILVFATGYDALTGALTEIDISGRDNVMLKTKWKDGPMNYLGIMTAGFPNLFIITGPGSPSVLVNMFVSTEQHVEWVGDCIDYMREHELASIEAERGAELDWVEHVNEVADTTLYPRANSWYLGSNIPGKARVFLPYAGGIGRYREKCDEVAANGYTGFHFEEAAGSADTSSKRAV